MKKALLTLGLVAAVLSSAKAGALFDDYLNYVRPGASTGPGNMRVTASSSEPVGQSFTLPEKTGEVYRIGVRPVSESWEKGEKVTLALYDSPEKKKKLGECTIDEQHSHAPVFDENANKDSVLYFRFRKPTGGDGELYFELTVSGGDGKVSFSAFDGDSYPGGKCYAKQSASDLSFDCHVKPAADREENLRKFFTERLDLSRPELAPVKAKVDARDWEGAISEAAKHFHERTEVLGDYKDWGVIKVDPAFDLKEADALMKYTLPDPPNASFFGWKAERDLAVAYDATGKEDYARKAIDLRMQMIIDCPNPKIAGVPRYFHLWNDRSAPARAPGYGTLVYARLYNYPGWTNDEKLIWFSFFEDNAVWCFGAESGANWGAEVARGAYEFGLLFPEWKISPECLRWGSQREAEIALGDIRADGTSAEASVKYHSMVARRLKGMMDHYIDGSVKFDKETGDRLMKRLEDMYDHMMYSMQPDVSIGADRLDHFAVMYGDSFNENYAEEIAEVGRMVKRPDFLWAAKQGKEGQPPREISKVYPEGGFFIMRSDFGGNGLPFTDSRQLFIHNGDWSGSHAHYDHTAINGLYAYGRPLIIDPGQYMGGNDTPPPGYDRYWNSKIHSCLVKNGTDMGEDPGPNDWVSNPMIDFYDGRHMGYGKVDYVRRRVAFIKPGYFLVDDSIKGTNEADWAQVWNLSDINARVDAASKTVETTYKDGGNLLIVNQDPEKLSVEEGPGLRTGLPKDKPATKIVRLHQKTGSPRFRTLLFPYKGGTKPEVEFLSILPDDTALSDMFYSVRVKSGSEMDWSVFGECGKTVAYRGGSHKADADFACVDLDPKGEPQGFSWARGKKLVFGGKTLASSDTQVVSLSVRYDGTKLLVEAKDADSTLAVRANSAKTFVLNGKQVAKPAIKEGMFLPFADQPKSIVADDRSGFERITAGNEWAPIPDPNSFANGYTRHETDPGRGESGNYVFTVPKAGRYRIELNLSKITTIASDKVRYSVPATGVPASVGGAITSVDREGDAQVFTVNQQVQPGWIKLGEFDLQAGQFKIGAKNVTANDGIYFIADAMRLLEVKK